MGTNELISLVDQCYLFSGVAGTIDFFTLEQHGLHDVLWTSSRRYPVA